MKKYILGCIFILVASSIFAQVRIDAPALVAPTDNKTNQMPDVVLDWNPVIGAVTYQLQLAQDESFTTIVIDSVTDLSAVKTSHLTFNLTYYWRVRAIDAQETPSFWSAPWGFTTFEKIDLYKPNNNATDQEPDVVLKWKDRISAVLITGVEHYEIQIDTDPGFSTPNFKEFITDGSTYEKALDQLLFGTTYHWRARASHSGDASEWSAVWKFTTLDVVELKKPNDNSVDQALNVSLRWDDLSGFKKFDYQLDIHEDFSSPTTYITELTIIPAEDLKYGTKYFWRMRGRHDNDTTNWADAWNFTTAAKVNLTSPVEGSDSVALKPQFKWSQILGTTGYEVEYSSDNGFAESVINHIAADDETVPFFNVLYALDPGTMYYWRVRAYSEIDTSDYSTTGTFITMVAQGINEDFFGNASLSIYPNPARNVLNIKLNNTEEADVEFEIIDLVGQAVISRPLHFRAGESQLQILLDDVSNGVYMVKFIKNDAIYTSKLIINK